MKLRKEALWGIIILIVILMGLLIMFIVRNNMNGEYKIKLNINGKEVKATLVKNDTTKKLMELLPLDIEMTDLNNNEKYYFLDTSLDNDPKDYTTINKGDIMLYGKNCLVIFYETFTTNYKYTKLGTIDDPSILDNIGNDNIQVKIIK